MLAIAESIALTIGQPAARAQQASSEKASLPIGTTNPIRVPFELYVSGLIIVEATCADKVIRCRLDTGSYITFLPKALNIQGKAFSHGRFFDAFPSLYQIGDAYGAARPMRSITVPDIRLGSFDVQNVVAEVVPSDNSSQTASPSESFWSNQTLLPGTLFKDSVLCIDYEHRELVIFPAGYTPSPEVDPAFSSEAGGSMRLRQGDMHVIPFELVASEKNVTIGRPVINAMVEGFPARMLIDTGWIDSTIGLCPDLYTKIENQRKKAGGPVGQFKALASHWLGGATVQVDSLTDITTTVASSASDTRPYEITTEGQKTVYMDNDTDGMLGWSFLRHFRRVTFDYGRKKIYFEAWPPGSSQDRTGAFANPAMKSTAGRRQAATLLGIPNSSWDTFFGAFVGGKASVHDQPANWNGVQGDLWDDGTFIPAAFIP